MPEMKGLILRGFAPAQFQTYLAKEVAPKIKAWRPRGVVLHNTGAMKWPGVAGGKTITPEQRLRNMSVDWVARKFRGGPHLVIAPDGMIWAAWPLWMAGTHSPSFNSTYWGIEMVGDFRAEAFPPALKNAAVAACAGLLAMIGREATDDSLKFHREDPRTTHKQCPGSNVGTKAQWLKNVGEVMHAMNPGELGHAA